MEAAEDEQRETHNDAVRRQHATQRRGGQRAYRERPVRGVHDW